MDRIIVYPGSIPQDADLLSTNKNAMLALGALAQAVIGAGPSVFGLRISSPSGLQIAIAPGGIFSTQDVDATAYGSLSADTTDTIVKCGFNVAATDFTLTAPGTAGQSINYLIEATFAETDTDSVVLPYYNASNPSLPYLGPGNDGAAQNTLRTQTCSLQLKAGAAANTGTQTTPSVDAGWTGLWIITINNGQSTITSAAWSQYPGAPFLPMTLAQARIKLSAPLNLYVSTNGSDSNSGLSSTAAFATIQHAWNTLQSSYDLNGQTVTINLAAGSYAQILSASGQLVGQNGVPVIITGASGVTWNNAATPSVTCEAINDAILRVTGGMTMEASTAGGEGGVVIVAQNSGRLLIDDITFGTAASGHIAANFGGLVVIDGNYTISGSAPTHVTASQGGVFDCDGTPLSGITVTVTGTPAFSNAFAYAYANGTVNYNDTTFSGSATGACYSATLNGVIFTNGAGASYFPGGTAGTTATGGQYA